MKLDANAYKYFKGALGLIANGEYEPIITIGHAQYHRVTGAIAIASTLAPGVPWQLESIRIHLSAVGAAGDLTATLDHGADLVYDVVILTQDMTAVTDFIQHYERPMEFEANDELDIAWANASTRTYGLEIVWKAR